MTCASIQLLALYDACIENYQFDPRFRKIRHILYTYTFSSDYSYSAYIDLLHLEPRGGNSADSIISRADVIVLSSDDGRISAFGDRALNCLIVGFRDAKTKADFIQLFGGTHIYTLQEAIKQLLPPNYERKDVFESNLKVN